MSLTVSSTVNLDLPGKQRGYLQIGDSTNASGWAMATVPIVSVKGGSGPTVLVVGGSHGDEYEGPFAIANLVRELEPQHVEGHVIALPSLSPSAAAAGTRLWPDGTDLDRRFPGDERGSVADKLVAYLACDLIDRCDALIDIHSGGRGLMTLPAATMVCAGDAVPSWESEQRDSLLRNVAGWQCQFAMLLPVMTGFHHRSQLSGHAVLSGISLYTAVFGGAGITTGQSNRMASRGLTCALQHARVLSPEWNGPAATETRQPDHADTTVIDLRGSDCFHWATEEGIFENLREPGDPVMQGELLGWIHDAQSQDKPATAVRAACCGVVGIVRGFPRVKRGDICVALGPTYTGLHDIPPAPE